MRLSTGSVAAVTNPENIKFTPTTEHLSMYSVTAIPAFTDNYIWSIEWPDGVCVIVDPGEAAPVLDYLQTHDRRLSHILLTHHHFDHIGGVKSLLSHSPVPVIGPVDERIDCITRTVVESDCFELHGVEFQVLEIPGHTRSHIAFYTHNALFCGDTLFSVGCGRLFEGTPAQMQISLDKLAALPVATAVYCAHEYTESNARFALMVEPDNQISQAPK